MVKISNAIVITTLLIAMLTFSAAAQDPPPCQGSDICVGEIIACDVPVDVVRWCTGNERMLIPFYFVGDWTGTKAQSVQQSFLEAVEWWNFSTEFGYGIPLKLVNYGPPDFGIKVRYQSNYFEIYQGFFQGFCWLRPAGLTWSWDVIEEDGLSKIRSVTISFDMTQNWNGMEWEAKMVMKDPWMLPMQRLTRSAMPSASNMCVSIAKRKRALTRS